MKTLTTKTTPEGRAVKPPRSSPSHFTVINRWGAVAGMVVSVLTVTGAGAAHAMQCTDFVRNRLAAQYPTRDYSALSGNAGSWVKSTVRAVGVMAVNSRPFQGAIMVFAGDGDRARYPSYASFAAGSSGHVALVRGVDSSTSIRVDQANWPIGSGPTNNVKVVTGDSWLTASVATPSGNMGAGRYAVAGFVNPSAFPSKKK